MGGKQIEKLQNNELKDHTDIIKQDQTLVIASEFVGQALLHLKFASCPFQIKKLKAGIIFTLTKFSSHQC